MKGWSGHMELPIQVTLTALWDKTNDHGYTHKGEWAHGLIKKYYSQFNKNNYS